MLAWGAYTQLCLKYLINKYVRVQLIILSGVKKHTNHYLSITHMKNYLKTEIHAHLWDEPTIYYTVFHLVDVKIDYDTKNKNLY